MADRPRSPSQADRDQTLVVQVGNRMAKNSSQIMDYLPTAARERRGDDRHIRLS
jgi:hypothetical protein